MITNSYTHLKSPISKTSAGVPSVQVCAERAAHGADEFESASFCAMVIVYNGRVAPPSRFASEVCVRMAD